METQMFYGKKIYVARSRDRGKIQRCFNVTEYGRYSKPL
jgi:hypothetical protein